MEKAPSNAEEYLERFHRNQRIEGFGIGNVYMHVPCPFCAAPDFIAYEILQVEEAMKKETTCKECGRSTRAIFRHEHGGVQFEFVQTGGPDQPDWFQPKMRRIEAENA